MKLSDYGRFAQVYTEKPYGFYKLGFSTTIHQATDLDIKLAKDYGKELVSSFQKVMLPLLVLEVARETNTLTSHETVYYAKVGKTYWGKLIISIQRYPFTNTITFIYKYRTKINDLLPKSHKPKVRRTTRESNELRNKHDQIYRHMKEE